MMKKLAAALLAAATIVSVSAPAFARPTVKEVADELGLEYEWVQEDQTHYLSGDLDLGTLSVTDGLYTIPVMTDDSLGTGNIDDDVVLPGKTYYVSVAGVVKLLEIEQTGTWSSLASKALRAIGSDLTDKKLVKFSTKKEEGSKLVDSVKLVEKTFGMNYGHLPAIEIKMNDFYTDDEQKIELNVEFKLKDDYDFTKLLREVIPGIPGNRIIFKDGSTICADIEFWTNNAVETTDGEDVMAGEGGAIWKPTKNEEQEYTWEDENNTLATLKYDSDDGQTKMYYKLSTKWDNAYYAENFADQDAFLYDFIAGPSASSTSRATLSLRVPFVDEDGELTCAEDEIYVYEMNDDGTLADVSNKFTFMEDEDSDGYVLQTKLRELGTYVVAGPVGAAEEEVSSEGIHTGIFLDAYAG